MSSSIYSPLLFVHILAAFLLTGTGLAALLARRPLLEASTADDLQKWLRFTLRATRMNPLAALFLLGSGIYLGLDGWWRTGWFAVACVAWLINSILAAAVIRKHLGATAQRAEETTELAGSDADRMRHSPLWQRAEDVLFANDVAMIYVMIDKPGLLRSVLIMLVANALMVAYRFAVRSQRTAPVAAHAGSVAR